MHPVLTEIRERYPEQVCIVMRYATFHDGSHIAVRILETARLQNRSEPAPEALLVAQPQWADHSCTRLDIAWVATAEADLDVVKTRTEMDGEAIDNVLAQDALDVETVEVRRTRRFRRRPTVEAAYTENRFSHDVIRRQSTQPRHPTLFD